MHWNYGFQMNNIIDIPIRIKSILRDTWAHINFVPGFFFFKIFLGSGLGILIICLILFIVYADLSPKNRPVRTIIGTIDQGESKKNKIMHRKEEHVYRFQGNKDDLVILTMYLDPHVLYDTDLLLENPGAMFENILEEYYVEKELGIIVKEFLLNTSGTYTVLVKYDFEKQHNYYDFDLFWFNFDEYTVIYPNYELNLIYINAPQN